VVDRGSGDNRLWDFHGVHAESLLLRWLSGADQDKGEIVSDVVCNGCRACCQGEVLILHPEMGDKPWEYLCRTMRNPLTGNLDFALAQQDNGDCVYLGPDGCTNYANRPAICREFDCRKFYQKVISGSSKLLKLAHEIGGSDDVMNAGKARLHTL